MIIFIQETMGCEPVIDPFDGDSPRSEPALSEVEGINPELFSLRLRGGFNERSVRRQVRAFMAESRRVDIGGKNSTSF